MRRKAIVYQDVYLDGYDNHFFADRKAARLLSPEGAKRARWFRSAFLNRRFFHYMFFVGLAPYMTFTQRYGGIGMRINNFFHHQSDVSRSEREAIATADCPDYIPALVDGYRKLMPPTHLDGWANYEVKDEWTPIPERTGHPNEDDHTIPHYSLNGFRTNPVPFPLNK